MLLVHVLGIILGMLASLVGVPFVHALGLGEFVDLTPNETSKEFLGECVGDRLA